MAEPGLESQSDEALCALAKSSVEAEGVLLSRYLRLIRFYAGRYAADCDVDDLVQEGLIALLQAIPQFDPSQKKRFLPYAQVCIQNRMRSFLRKERSAASPAEDLLAVMEAQGEFIDPETPESIFLEKENFQAARMQVMALLSDREWEILQCMMEGATYAEAARRLGTTPKSIDNAMQRIRRKMRAVRSAEHSEEN